MSLGPRWTVISIALCLLCAHACVADTEPAGPIDFGRRDLDAALAKLALKPGTIRHTIGTPGQHSDPAYMAAEKALPKKAESFAIARVGKDVAIVGRDEAGAMYGCFELAERIANKGRLALDIRKPISQSPAVDFRAVNPFLTLPYGTETDETWWFLSDDYWRGYLDMLARARINWVDLHGMYDIKSTGFPNLYPYFITSEKFPDVGVEPAVAQRNLNMLNRVAAMAKARGIKFAVMSYAANWSGAGLRKPTSESSEANLSAYTREVVRKMIESCPDLAMIGFRIGETGRSEEFFKDSYIPAIREAGREIDLYTRSWLSKKPPILEIGREFPGRFFVEIKYNGEQFGPPYIVSGGRTVKWHSYFYQDYYSYPRSYKILYQLRANGTHRAFPWGNPELAARANIGSLFGGSLGACIEPIDSYYPKTDFRHRDDYPHKWFTWQYQRDWFWNQVWGRTAYDPSLGHKDDVWVSMFTRRFGKAGADLYAAMKWASMIVPDAYNAYSLGPDHRNHAPELEWGGNVKKWADGQPFDTQNIQSPKEFASRLLKGDHAGTATPLTMAGYLSNEASMTRKHLALAKSKAANRTAEFDDLVIDLTALSHLGDYYAHKLRAATAFATMRESSDVTLAARIRKDLEQAHAAWMELAKIGDANFRPFVDTLRMHTEEYAWSKEAGNLPEDFKALDDAVAAIRASGKTGRAPRLEPVGDGKGPSVRLAKFALNNVDGGKSKRLTVTVHVTDPAGVQKVYLKTKPLPSERDWGVVPMGPSGSNTYTAEVAVFPEGLQWCVETVDKHGNGSQWPSFRAEMPYRAVFPWDAPAPDAPSAGE